MKLKWNLVYIFNIKIYILVEIHGCKTWHFNVRWECKIKVGQKKIQSRMFEPKKGDNGENGKIFTIRKFIIYTRSHK